MTLTGSRLSLFLPHCNAPCLATSGGIFAVPVSSQHSPVLPTEPRYNSPQLVLSQNSTNFSPELPNFIPATQALLSCTAVCKKLTLRSITWHNKCHRRNVEAVSGGSLPSSRPPLSRARESLILCYHNHITYFLFSSHKWSRIINKSTASLNWQRAHTLIAVPPYIWSEMLRWWKAHASLCVFCSARELRSAAPVQLSCAQAACSQAWNSPGSHREFYTHTSASLAPGLHKEQAFALVRSEPLPLLFRIQPSNSSCVQFPWLPLTCHCINWLQSLSIQNFETC